VREAVIEACPTVPADHAGGAFDGRGARSDRADCVRGATAFAIMRGLLVASLPTILVPPTACVTGLERGRASPSPAPRVANRLVPAQEMP
jgi:hypothetical protein